MPLAVRILAVEHAQDQKLAVGQRVDYAIATDAKTIIRPATELLDVRNSTSSERTNRRENHTAVGVQLGRQRLELRGS